MEGVKTATLSFKLNQDVPVCASLAMFKEAVLISALVRRSRVGYPQESHIAMIAEYA